MWNVWKIYEDKEGVLTYEVLRGFDNRPLRFDSEAKAHHFVDTFECCGQDYKLIVTPDDSKL